jgi:hypothetical protein
MSRPFRSAPFAKIALAVAAPVPPQQVTPEALQETVLALRGDRR